MQIFKCYSSKLANYLTKLGFEIIGIEANMKKPWLDVFLFEDSVALRIAFDKYCLQ